MKLNSTLLKLYLPDDVIFQSIAEIGDILPGHFKQLHIPYIDELILLHSAILDCHYGLYITSTNCNNNSIIHRDVRLSAINFALRDCGSGADTVFFKPVSTIPKFIGVIPAKMNQIMMSYLIEPTVEIDRSTLYMGECMLLDTQVPHVVRNTTRPNRLVLSIDCKVSYREAYEYFANLGLIEVDVLDSDGPFL